MTDAKTIRAALRDLWAYGGYSAHWSDWQPKRKNASAFGQAELLLLLDSRRSPAEEHPWQTLERLLDDAALPTLSRATLRALLSFDYGDFGSQQGRLSQLADTLTPRLSTRTLLRIGDEACTDFARYVARTSGLGSDTYPARSAQIGALEEGDRDNQQAPEIQLPPDETPSILAEVAIEIDRTKSLQVATETYYIKRESAGDYTDWEDYGEDNDKRALSPLFYWREGRSRALRLTEHWGSGFTTKSDFGDLEVHFDHYFQRATTFRLTRTWSLLDEESDQEENEGWHTYQLSLGTLWMIKFAGRSEGNSEWKVRPSVGSINARLKFDDYSKPTEAIWEQGVAEIPHRTVVTENDLALTGFEHTFTEIDDFALQSSIAWRW